MAMTGTPAALGLFAVALLCAGCFGSATGHRPRVRASAFVIVYTPGHGDIAPTGPPTRRLHLDCTGRHTAACAAVTYVLSHPPRHACATTSFATPAAMAVSGALLGRRVFDQVAPVCGGHGPMARATNTLFTFAAARA